jgi:hypothetical protein
MKKTFNLFILFLTISIGIKAQISFERANRLYKKDVLQYSGMAGSFIDLNGDLYDDLVVLNKSKFLEVGYNQGSKSILRWLPPLKVHTSEEYSIVVGDYDNDGVSEITSGGTFSGSKIYKADGQGIYGQSQNVGPLIYTQAANVIDFNNDGFLDYFACHDEGNNLMLQNDKMGNLIATNIIDFNTLPASDNSGNYGSEWCDIDNDGDQDLYIAKCRFGVIDREDPRRHNMLFINKGNGTFVNEAEARGLKDKGQSWTGSFADFDNDGDMDCVITNHDDEHGFYENDGNGFFKPIQSLFLPTSFAFQSLWSDFDNDGFVDLLITGADASFIYHNLDGKTFEKIVNPLGPTTINSASLGDINDDGFVDINAIYGININFPSSIKDELFINAKNNNHFLKFAFIGTKSNKLGIGSRLTLYGPWGKQSREVQSGVSYGISNSLTQIFGLGSNVKADSLVINWPSGNVDKYYDIAADDLYVLQEKKCMTKRINIESTKDYVCENESVSLSTFAIYDQYKWSNGSTNPTIIVSNEGAYTLKATNLDGCENYSKIKFISKTTANQNYILPAQDSVFFCKEIFLETDGILTDVKWNNTDGSGVINIKESTTLNLTAKDRCNNVVSDKIIVNKIVTDLQVISDTVAKGGTAILKVKGENVKWYSDKEKTKLVFEGNELTLVNVQKTSTFFVQSNVNAGIKQYSIGEKNIPNTGNDYAANNNDIGLYFNAYQDLVIKSFDVASDVEGVRRFLVLNYYGDTIGSKDIFIGKTEKQVVEVNFKVPQGTLYQLKTDELINLTNFNFNAPRLKRIQINTNFPYEVYGVAEIPVSLRGGLGYYYFFNIQIQDNGINCESDLQEVKALLDTEVATFDIADQIQIFPNPVASILNLISDQAIDLEIYNELGVKVYNSKLGIGNNMINVSQFYNGIYHLRLKTKSTFMNKKIIVQN